MKKVTFKNLLHIFLILLVSTLIIDFIRISNYDLIPKEPSIKTKQYHNQMQWDLANGKAIEDWSLLDPTLKFIKNEYDCSDFRLVNLIRILYESDNHIPKDYKAKIEGVLFNFRYWWDEPGENSMCYWSENHQILFASAEYLVGQKYPDTIFPSSGLTGKQRMEKAKKRALDWLEMRWNYGFIEFNSGVYYAEDIAALINIIDFVEDEELLVKSRMIMDLLFYDVAVQNIQTMFVTTSGRAYKRNRMGGPDEILGGITSYYWGDGKPIKASMMYGMMASEKYELPAVLAEIAKDSSEVIIKQSNGLDISELKAEGFYGADTRSMMMQWGMEAFSDPRVLKNSLAHIRNCNMFSNEFLSAFKWLDFSFFKWFHLEPSIVNLINPQSNGTAIQKGNTYTYKTKDYSMYSAQNYHPGTYGDQQHVFGVNIKDHFSIFHTHPALPKHKKHHSPNYEVGYGHFPHVAQHKNVSIAIYNIPDKKGILEMDLLDLTRAYFPSEKFDTAFINGNYVFGKKDETYCAFIGANDFNYADDAHDDIIQVGKHTFWITEVSSLTEDDSFEKFTQRIMDNKLSFNAKTLELTYQSNNNKYNLKFNGDFLINGKIIDTNYSRYDSPYITAKRKDKTLTFKFKGKSLFLDFQNLTREFN